MDPNAPTRTIAAPRALKPLPPFRVASPCSKSWGSMSGDEKQRTCERCRRYVVDPTAMTQPEIDQMLKAVGSEEGGAVRAWRREDGTLILGSDCTGGPVLSPDEALKKTLFGAIAGAIAIAAVAVWADAFWAELEIDMATQGSSTGAALRSLLGRPPLRVPPTKEEIRARRRLIWDVPKDTRAS